MANAAFRLREVSITIETVGILELDLQGQDPELEVDAVFIPGSAIELQNQDAAATVQAQPSLVLLFENPSLTIGKKDQP